MIKVIIKLFIRPVQTIFDAIRHQKGQRKMMSYLLKTGHEFNCQPENKG